MKTMDKPNGPAMAAILAGAIGVFVIGVMTTLAEASGKATETLIYKVYTDGVVNLDLGGSSAQSVILLLVVITLTAVQFRYVERRVHY